MTNIYYTLQHHSLLSYKINGNILLHPFNIIVFCLIKLMTPQKIISNVIYQCKNLIFYKFYSEVICTIGLEDWAMIV
jgi:hypothetical protein